MKTFSLTKRVGGPDQADDECDIEYRAVDEKYTIASNVPDWLASILCAAPDLLAVCQRLLAWADDPTENVATGTGSNAGWVKMQADTFQDVMDIADAASAAIAKAEGKP